MYNGKQIYAEVKKNGNVEEVFRASGHDRGLALEENSVFYSPYADRKHCPAALQYSGQRGGGQLRGGQCAGRSGQRGSYIEFAPGTVCGHQCGRGHHRVPVFRGERAGEAVRYHRELYHADGHSYRIRDGGGLPCVQAAAGASGHAGVHH